MPKNATPPERGLPRDVLKIIATLEQAGYGAYAVGGCVRDVLLRRPPQDWDIATSAKPEEIQALFPQAVYNNRFGTVAVHFDHTIYEVTTFRTEADYRDARHPATVTFVSRLEDDLARRDFTINAMAMQPGGKVIDPFKGQQALTKKVITAVGNPRERFEEDALRMLRAVRLAVQLDFTIAPATQQAISQSAELLEQVSAERVRDELLKILASDNPYRGFKLLLETGLLARIIPELLEGTDLDQPKHHRYPVLQHNLLSLKHTPSADPLVRLAALLHDVGKPRSARGSGDQRTFHGHEVVGARLTKQIMQRLKFSKADTERVVSLVRHHMFLFQFDSTDKAVRRIVRRVGPENIRDLVALRVGDRLGSGCKIGYTKKLKTFEERVVAVQQDPIDTRMLVIDGHDIMRDAQLPAGPVIGQIMNQLLEEILDDPQRNTREYLMRRAQQLAQEGLPPTSRAGRVKR